ncbi:MAG: hypothetical protein J6Y28_08215 [Acholeplasmatales bacterium]|nr:hypothetical protein [Acholeplasmatales bacterium]
MFETDNKNLYNILGSDTIARKKKIRLIIIGVATLVLIVIIIIIIASLNKKSSSTQPSDLNGDTQKDKLPQHMVTGYWHNFCNGSTNLKLKDVPSYYDMICVAFTGNTATPGEVTFELDSYLASSVGGYSKEEFIQDIKDIKSKGRHVIISVGGANGRIVIDSEKASDKFASSLIEIIKEYGFEGVDIDLEGSAVSGTEYIASGLRKAHDEFGDDFIITMAPETYYMHKAEGLMGAYYRLATKIKDILTICYPQFYNAGGDIGYNDFNARYPSQSFITSLATMYIENGLRPDQMAIGVPAAASAGGTGYISTDALKEVIYSLVYKKELDGFTPPREYKTLRGVMTWSINWDGTQNYAWGKSMSELMDSLPIVDRGSERPEQDEKKSDETDDKESDNTSDSSEDEGTGDIPAWDSSKAYFKGDKVVYKGKIYEAKWWTQGDIPDEQDQWGPWKYIRDA